jgi:hypothetical protein
MSYADVCAFHISCSLARTHSLHSRIGLIARRLVLSLAHARAHAHAHRSTHLRTRPPHHLSARAHTCTPHQLLAHARRGTARTNAPTDSYTRAYAHATSQAIVVPTFQECKCDLIANGPEPDAEKDRLLENFTEWAIGVCTALRGMGYWAVSQPTCDGASLQRVQSNARTCTRMRLWIHQADAGTRVHSGARTHTNSRARARTHTHTHTHILTNAHMLIVCARRLYPGLGRPMLGPSRAWGAWWELLPRRHWWTNASELRRDRHWLLQASRTPTMAHPSVPRYALHNRSARCCNRCSSRRCACSRRWRAIECCATCICLFFFHIPQRYFATL